MEEFIKSRVLRITGKDQFDVSLLARAVRRVAYELIVAAHRFPSSAETLKQSAIFKKWWYYTIELLPGITKAGIYPEDFPNLPRVLMRNCDLAGLDCLDLGSMEGLMPALMRRQGARKVLATDASFHCYEKMAALKHYHKVEFDFQQTGSMYDLAEKLRNHGGFDLINLSGILYHVFSPMHVIAGVRPLLKRNGLMIVSTNVVNRDDYSMEFNNGGKLQSEGNTFWYPSIPLFEYMLRYLRLTPIDCIYKPHTSTDHVRYVESLEAGYLAVVCRAAAKAAVSPEDRWALRSSEESWEILNALDLEMIARQPESRIRYRGEPVPHAPEADDRSIDLLGAVRRMPPMLRADRLEDSHRLGLADES